MHLVNGYETLDFFYWLGMTQQGYQLDHSPSLRLLKMFFVNFSLPTLVLLFLQDLELIMRPVRESRGGGGNLTLDIEARGSGPMPRPHGGSVML